MRIAFDTSAYSALSRSNARIAEILTSSTLIVISPIVIAELVTGFRGGNRELENRERLQRFCNKETSLVVPVDEDTAEMYSELQHYLKREGTPIPTNDVWIAATAMQHGCRVLTTDEHFRRIPQIFTVYVPVN